jgi:putative transposase
VKIRGERHYLWRAVAQDGERYANNLAEVSHQQTRQRERQMRESKSAGSEQPFLSVHGAITNRVASPPPRAIPI